ncbi:AAA ATPase, partial [Balamuthia mandrillaris]
MPKKKSREVLALQKEAEKLQRRAEARERKGGLISPPRRTRNSLQNSPASESRIDRRSQQRGKAKPKKLDLTSPTTTPPTTKRTKSNAATKGVAASENNVDRKRRFVKREPKQPKQLDFSSPSTTPKRAASTSATTPRRLLRSNTCTDSQLAVTSKLRSKEAQLLCQEMNKQKEREKRRDLPKKPMEYRPNNAKTQVSFNPNAFLYRQHTMNEAELSLLLNDFNYPWNDEPLEPQQWAKVEERFSDAQRAMSKGDKSSSAIHERQEEQNRIIAFWQRCVLQRKKTREKEESSGGAMYISGMPGTGKTASLQCVVRYMQSWEHSQELHSK